MLLEGELESIRRCPDGQEMTMAVIEAARHWETSAAIDIPYMAT